jgi:hypothetical protein
VVVADLDVVGVAVLEAKADPPLVVDRNGMLAGSISGEGVEPIAPRYPQILETDRQIEILELSDGAPPDVRRPAGRPSRGVQRSGVSIREGLDHARSVMCHVMRVNASFTPDSLHGTSSCGWLSVRIGVDSCERARLLTHCDRKDVLSAHTVVEPLYRATIATL